MKKLAVLSLSGGMDSTSLLIKLLREGFSVECIGFNYGQKHVVELEKADLNIEYLQNIGFNVHFSVCDLSSIMKSFESSLLNSNIQDIPEGHYEEENMKSTVVPNRNAIFSSIIYGKALSISIKEKNKVSICMGVHSGDHAIYPDCRPEFHELLNKAFEVGNWGSELIDYYTPYMSFNKTDILKDCYDNCKILNLDFYHIMKNTNTSYNPDKEGKSSGTSGADIERIEAFINLGLKDPIEYTHSWDKVVKNAKYFLKI